jgi:hypothetical protein
MNEDATFEAGEHHSLTGHRGQDQFVFAPDTSGTAARHMATDFAGVDNIEVRQLENASASLAPIEVRQANDTPVALDHGDSLLMKNPVAVLHATEFLLHA